MAWNMNLTNLKDVLVELFPFKEDSVEIVREATISLGQIRFDNKASVNWSNILDEADKLGKVNNIIQAALKKYSDNALLQSALVGELNTVREFVTTEKFWTVPEKQVDELERIIGSQSTLLPISWLEVGLERAKSVVKIKRADNTNGTGFLIYGDLLVTNHHVIDTPQQARSATVIFNYQETVTGLSREPIFFKLDPNTFFQTSGVNDWTIVKIKGEVKADWELIELKPVTIQPKDRANIIQHPGGETKQIAVYHNIVAEVSNNRVQYLTDTLPGSSGSPVFNNNWELIASHYKTLRRDEVEAKKISNRNEGIDVNCILAELKKRGITLPGKPVTTAPASQEKAATDYFKLHFDKAGRSLDRQEFQTLIKAVTDSPKPVTDLWLMSHGWKNDEKGAGETYDKLFAALQERIQAEVQDPNYNPVFAGIYWPSKDHLGEVLAATMRQPLSGGAGIEEWELESNKPEEGLDKTGLIEAYRSAFENDDPQTYEADFGRLYDLLTQEQTHTPAEIEEFVSILEKYKVNDPEPEAFESDNLATNPQATIQALKTGLEGREKELGKVLKTLGEVLDNFTFWAMKARAGVVGQSGVAEFLKQARQTFQEKKLQVRIHLLGHSFGCKLLTACVNKVGEEIEAPVVDSLILLLGAFSQFSFASQVPVKPGGQGRYAGVVARKLVTAPIVAIYSRHDYANSKWYPRGMLTAKQEELFEHDPQENPRGAMGSVGAQGLQDHLYDDITLKAVDRSYDWRDLSGFACLNVNGEKYINDTSNKQIGAHGDIYKPEIFHLALELSRRNKQ